MHAPRVGRRGQVAHGVLDDGEQLSELVGRPAEVVGGQQPQRDDLDAAGGAPAEQVLDLVGAAAMARADVVGARSAGPATVAVEDDADVAGQRCVAERVQQPTLVDAVHQIAQTHARLLPPQG